MLFPCWCKPSTMALPTLCGRNLLQLAVLLFCLVAGSVLVVLPVSNAAEQKPVMNNHLSKSSDTVTVKEKGVASISTKYVLVCNDFKIHYERLEFFLLRNAFPTIPEVPAYFRFLYPGQCYFYTVKQDRDTVYWFMALKYNSGHYQSDVVLEPLLPPGEKFEDSTGTTTTAFVWGSTTVKDSSKKKKDGYKKYGYKTAALPEGAADLGFWELKAKLVDALKKDKEEYRMLREFKKHVPALEGSRWDGRSV